MNKIIEFIIERLSQFGQIPLCNGVADRAPHFGNFCFPLCYRCTFVILVFFITLFICYSYKKNVPFIFAMLCLIPMVIDGSLQTFLGILSTNLRRIITGGLFGFGLGSFIARVYDVIDERG